MQANVLRVTLANLDAARADLDTRIDVAVGAPEPVSLEDAMGLAREQRLLAARELAAVGVLAETMMTQKLGVEAYALAAARLLARAHRLALVADGAVRLFRTELGTGHVGELRRAVHRQRRRDRSPATRSTCHAGPPLDPLPPPPEGARGADGGA